MGLIGLKKEGKKMKKALQIQGKEKASGKQGHLQGTRDSSHLAKGRRARLTASRSA